MSQRVLLVSYDERVLIARRKLLEQEGYRVSSGLRFREAIAICQRGLGELLILDCSIPRRDWDELIRAFRAISDAPILALWSRNKGFAEGANYVVFSDDPDRLATDVATILAKQGSAQASG